MVGELGERRVLRGVGTPRTMRAHWALHELSLPYETEAIGSRTVETQTAEFSSLNPCQKIPVLRDGDFTISESAAIIAYLAEVYGSEKVRLVPAGQHERARWLEWSFFIAMELDATTLYVIRRHGGLPDVYGEAPAAVECAKSYFFKQLGLVDQTLRTGAPFLIYRSERGRATQSGRASIIASVIDRLPRHKAENAYTRPRTGRILFAEH